MKLLLKYLIFVTKKTPPRKMNYLQCSINEYKNTEGYLRMFILF